MPLLFVWEKTGFSYNEKMQEIKFELNLNFIAK